MSGLQQHIKIITSNSKNDQSTIVAKQHQLVYTSQLEIVFRRLLTYKGVKVHHCKGHPIL